MIKLNFSNHWRYGETEINFLSIEWGSIYNYNIYKGFYIDIIILNFSFGIIIRKKEN